MRLREFFKEVRQLPPQCLDYPLFIAAPDNVEGDSVDVQLAQVGQVREPMENGQRCLVPNSEALDEAESGPYETLESLLRALPSGLLEEDDTPLVVELPLDRDKPGYIHLSNAEIRDIYVGESTQEVWLLVRPKGDYPSESLPA